MLVANELKKEIKLIAKGHEYALGEFPIWANKKAIVE